ncbi:MAG: type II secretion system protein [Candidatus Rhabdochlamydia sp.]
MKRKRPFLLLEVIIAMTLMGLFAGFSMHTLYQSLKVQKDILQEFELTRLLDLEKMHLIETYWKSLDDLADKKEGILVESSSLISKTDKSVYRLRKNHKHLLKCQKSQDGKRYLLKITEVNPSSSKEHKQTYTYFLSPGK